MIFVHENLPANVVEWSEVRLIHSKLLIIMDAAEHRDSPLPLGRSPAIPFLQKKPLRNFHGDVRAFCNTKRRENLQKKT